MDQIKVISKRSVDSKPFVELHIEDLVRDCLKWHQQLNGQVCQRESLPSVIHGVDSVSIAVR